MFFVFFFGGLYNIEIRVRYYGLFLGIGSREGRRWNENVV